MTELLSALTDTARNAPESGIVATVNYGRTRAGLIPLWVGEGDLPTPAFICEAATASLAAGETFYTWQRGIPDLRAAIARYMQRTYGGSFGPERFFVTASGMQAIQIAMAMITSAGDDVLVPTPVWPNFAAAAGIRGARPVAVPMSFGNDGWVLDLERLEAAIGPRTKAMFINSPSNPCGWTATREELAAILAIARKHGIWIVADEIYGKFYFDGPVAPSFREVMTDGDKVMFVNTMSKNWAMTGWRVGWIECDPSLGAVVENMIQYSTSGVAQFIQRAAATALDHGDDFIAMQVGRARRGRDLVCDALAATGKVRFARPAGAFYLFFSVDGRPDTRQLSFDLVDRANIGLAPGTAFGAGGEAFLRMCFARGEDSLTVATERLVAAINAI